MTSSLSRWRPTACRRSSRRVSPWQRSTTAAVATTVTPFRRTPRWLARSTLRRTHIAPRSPPPCSVEFNTAISSPAPLPVWFTPNIRLLPFYVVYAIVIISSPPPLILLCSIRPISDPPLVYGIYPIPSSSSYSEYAKYDYISLLYSIQCILYTQHNNIQPHSNTVYDHYDKSNPTPIQCTAITTISNPSPIQCMPIMTISNPSPIQCMPIMTISNPSPIQCTSITTITSSPPYSQRGDI